MSEANSPKDQEQPVQPAPESSPVAAEAKPAARGTAIAAVALLVGVVGVGVGGWSAWQLRALQSETQQQSAQLEQARSQAQALTQRTESLDDRFEQLPSVEELDERRRLVAQLQGDQQLLNRRLETVLGASRQDWRLAEAEHLLRLASLRLSALQDINSATALVQAADEILRDQDDPAAFAAREQLAKSLEALRATDNPDRTGLFLQLGALREQAAQLNSLNPKFVADGGVLGELAAESEPGTWWSQTLHKLSQYFRLDFNADQNVRPLLAGQSLSQVRLALSLALEQAQWAALHGQTQVYRQALQQAAEVLDANFNRDNPDSRALRARVGELVDQPIEVKAPELGASLNAVQAYIEHKQSARERLKDAPGEDAGGDGEAHP
ncbi:uroporphyrinogen-III C-methyltransferase [Phytopseudomonas punonensis]|uniref:Uroporphyrin-3 C-methyltransferase n=1 Tax=Phytopseudomonas punonensis TaxID=1220495 RepID=A0A1M6ZBR7_9GAMM|nr:uroporphyrinogen-III C-methyltransferase [Pseudomonas punonensis]SHL27908.1 uroporphyrin-3 C-methyltransferase [Pseudomonas punonensis]